MLSVGARTANRIDFCDDRPDFLIRGIEVRRDTDAGPFPVIHEKFPLKKLPGDFVSMGEVNGDGTGAFIRIHRRSDLKTIFLGLGNEERGLSFRLRADWGASDA